ncbi:MULTISPECIES: cistern family PEP-CTERM protein [Cyanophyceae]|uniref:Cistern family PEP-CTERM protein n=1 Tax=Leptolyngbya subtilissima DQ-A4 TaxID=2933933 RepID=A0ABV0JZ98_9CYAN|nr:cistern family PEP-CTERM protein [Nodosilinea sp. FACHB-141]MBD2112398.1 cistern family PEP-CTERM protein [Nodosilinea sp. FACHB-141]
MTTLNRLTASALTAGVLVASSLIASQPAQAFTFTSDKKAVTVTSADAGKFFTVDFDGNVDTTPIPGLTAKAVFTFLGFDIVDSLPDVTQAFFNVSITNNSTVAGSRISAIGFNTSPNLRGVGGGLANSGNGNTRVDSGGNLPTSVFNNDRSGAFPNQFGAIEVCFTDGNNCQGGSNGGVTKGGTGEFNPVLAFNNPANGSVSSFTLDNFGVRYQSITAPGINDGSGTGVGLVPTPALLPGLIGMGVAALRRRQQEESEVA